MNRESVAFWLGFVPCFLGGAAVSVYFLFGEHVCGDPHVFAMSCLLRPFASIAVGTALGILLGLAFTFVAKDT